MPSATSKTQTGNNSSSGSSIDHDTKVVINMIFARFHHIYTHRFESAYGDEATLNLAKREWAMSLNGFSVQAIEMAIERCKEEFAWPPTIAEFLKLLRPRPETLGLPSVKAAYAEACRNAHAASSRGWSHLLVQLAAQQVGYFVLRSESERSSKPLFDDAYLGLVERLMRGETFSAPETHALPEPDNHDYRKLKEQLINAGVGEADADIMTYYLEKPAQSEVRKRYRERSNAQLKQLQVKFDLPE